MEVSKIRKGVVMMLIIMLIVTHVECNSSSEEFEPTKLKGIPRAWCEFKCDLKCIGQRLVEKWEKCVKDCMNKKC
jgi:hypothetical protein